MTGSDTPAVGGGVGKYLKARMTQPPSSVAALDGDLPLVPVGKKRKVSSRELKDFSSW